jgi:hypothetical protein
LCADGMEGIAAESSIRSEWEASSDWNRRDPMLADITASSKETATVTPFGKVLLNCNVAVRYDATAS